MPESFGDRLRRTREEKRLSQAELAEKDGFPAVRDFAFRVGQAGSVVRQPEKAWPMRSWR